jgi:hypothetical protein
MPPKKKKESVDVVASDTVPADLRQFLVLLMPHLIDSGLTREEVLHAYARAGCTVSESMMRDWTVEVEQSGFVIPLPAAVDDDKKQTKKKKVATKRKSAKDVVEQREVEEEEAGKRKKSSGKAESQTKKTKKQKVVAVNDDEKEDDDDDKVVELLDRFHENWIYRRFDPVDRAEMAWESLRDCGGDLDWAETDLRKRFEQER